MAADIPSGSRDGRIAACKRLADQTTDPQVRKAFIDLMDRYRKQQGCPDAGSSPRIDQSRPELSSPLEKGRWKWRWGRFKLL